MTQEKFSMSQKKRKRNKRKKLRKALPLFIDTGPLLLFLVGSYRKEFIGKIKRVKNYNSTQFEILIQFLTGRRIYVTPGVLAEVSDFAKSIEHINFKDFIENNLIDLKEMGEIFIPKDSILETKEFIKFGYTDTTLLKGAQDNNGEILTDDSNFCYFCINQQLKAIHIEYLKDRASQFT